MSVRWVPVPAGQAASPASANVELIDDSRRSDDQLLARVGESGFGWWWNTVHVKGEGYRLDSEADAKMAVESHLGMIGVTP